MKFENLFDDTILVLLSLCGISLIVVYGLAIRKYKRLKLIDIYYLGHVFVLTLILFLIYACFYTIICFNANNPVKFSSKLWNYDRERRIEMIDDLTSNSILKLKSKKEVFKTLGIPLKDDTINSKVSYYLGFRKKAFTIDPDFLIIEFRNNVVSKFYTKPGVPYN